MPSRVDVAGRPRGGLRGGGGQGPGRGRQQVGLVEDKTDRTFDQYVEWIRNDAPFLDFAPVVSIGAKTGQRVGRVLELAVDIWAERRKRVPTGELNRMLMAATDRTPPPLVRGKRPKLYYATQAAIARRRSCSSRRRPRLCTSRTDAIWRTGCAIPSGSMGRRSGWSSVIARRSSCRDAASRAPWRPGRRDARRRAVAGRDEAGPRRPSRSSAPGRGDHAGRDAHGQGPVLLVTPGRRRRGDRRSSPQRAPTAGHRPAGGAGRVIRPRK